VPAHVPAPRPPDGGPGPSAEARTHALSPDLTVTLHPAGATGGRVVQLTGRLDAWTAPDLRRLLLELDHRCSREALLIVDLAGIHTADAAGLAPLVLAHRRALSRSYVLALAAPSDTVERVLRTHHLHATFTVLDTAGATTSAT
jgi:anti-anti-sigma factor